VRPLAEHRGFVKLPIVIAAALGIGFVASAYLNFYQHQQANQAQAQLQGQITDLTYQIKQDHAAGLGATPTATPSPSATTTSQATTASPSPSASPAVAGTASVSISQFGVNFTVSDPIVDLTYAPVESGGLIVAALTTQSLLAKYPSCTPANAALGMLVRRPQGQTPRSQDKFMKTLGGYNFYYVAPLSYCTADTAGRNIIAADTAALSGTALPTLSQ
jgi:hypothetical protein